MRIIRLFIMSAVFISVVLLTNPAQAYFVQSFSCGGGQKPILVGDNEDVVLMKCGQPTYREADAWIYDRGVDSTMAVISYFPLIRGKKVGAFYIDERR